MKIKLFENFDKLYHEIDVEEWEKFAGDDNITSSGADFWNGPKKLDGFTKVEIEKLKSLFGQGLRGNHMMELDKWIRYCNQNLNGLVSSLMLNSEFSVRKLDDEWYYVYDQLSYRFYKCDTFEGLIQCLEEV